MAKKQKYIKMGLKAAGFADPYSLVNISGKEVKKITNAELRSHKVAKAVLGGHLVMAEEEEYDAWVKFEASTRTGPEAAAAVKNSDLREKNKELLARIEELEANQKEPAKDDTPKFGNMNSKALVKYYKENYEVSDDEVEEFEDMELADKRKTLEDLENE